MKYFRGWRIPDDKDWCDGYSDKYDWAYFDEFRGQKKVNWLNSFTDGSPVPLNVRNSRPYIKRKNLPVIICSNMSIQGIFHNVNPLLLAALESRFIEIRTTEDENIDIQFEFDSSDEDTCEMLTEEDEMFL